MKLPTLTAVCIAVPILLSAPASAQKRADVLRRFDTNQDGRLDEDERAAGRAALRERRERADVLGRFDTNQDGRLDESERTAGRAALRERRERAGVLDRFDTNRDGRLDEGERAAGRAALRDRRERAAEPRTRTSIARRRALGRRAVEHFDADQDGRLDPDEREALRARVRAGGVLRQGRDRQENEHRTKRAERPDVELRRERIGRLIRLRVRWRARTRGERVDP